MTRRDPCARENVTVIQAKMAVILLVPVTASVMLMEDDVTPARMVTGILNRTIHMVVKVMIVA